jgi:hypothetical protein
MDGERECELSSVHIFNDGSPIEKGKTYKLKTRTDNSSASAVYTETTSKCGAGLVRYFTNELTDGELKITHFDPEKFIVSGTFWFDAMNAKGEKVEVREGRFDMQFT